MDAPQGSGPPSRSVKQDFFFFFKTRRGRFLIQLDALWVDFRIVKGSDLRPTGEDARGSVWWTGKLGIVLSCPYRHPSFPTPHRSAYLPSPPGRHNGMASAPPQTSSF